jgi:hypothetical protein
VWWLVTAIVLVAAGCRPPAPATPASAASPEIVAAPPTGASRVDVLNAADAAYRAGDTQHAAELYDRVVNTPPATSESPDLTRAVDDLARFRALLLLASAGNDADARAELASMQQDDPNGALTRLAAQFWDQYGMTAQLRAACAALRPQLGVAEATFTTLAAAGASVRADALCTSPGT